MSGNSVVYEARDISKSYGKVIALKNVNLKLRAGEIVGLVGDNGAGKSTLVKILSGTLMPDAGSMWMEGEQREWTSPRNALESGVETLYQDAGLCPDLSVSANVFLGREVRRSGLLGRLGFLDKRKMETESEQALERAGIGFSGVGRNVNQFSGGQQQAVAIGRAVAWASKVIILDEPTNHLGARQAGEVLRVMRRAREHGLAVVFISHTLPHVLEVTDRIVVLRLGTVVANSPTSDYTPESLLEVITGLSSGRIVDEEQHG